MDHSSSGPGPRIWEWFRLIAPLIVLAGGAAGMFGLYLLGTWSGPETGEADAEAIPLVRTIPIEPYDRPLEIEVDGLVVPHREIAISAEVNGQVIDKADNCEAGKFVAQGDLLLEIDPRDYELEVRRLTSELQQAEVQLEELQVEVANTQSLIELAQEQLDLRKKELRRLEQLAEKDYATDSQLDQERQNELAARNQLMTLRNQTQLLRTRRSRLERAKELTAARLERAELDLERTKIVAPVDGVVFEDLVEKGDYVAPGTAMARIEDTSAVEVKCSLRANELYWLWDQARTTPSAESAQQAYQIPEAPVKVVYGVAGREFEWDGVLWRYDGIGLDPKTRTVPCRVLVRSPRVARYAGELDDAFGPPEPKTPDSEGKLASKTDFSDHGLAPLKPVAQGEVAPGSGDDSSRDLRSDSGNVEKSPPIAAPPALVRQMFVRVRIEARPRTLLLRVPEVAVQPGNRLWLVRDGKLHIVKIHVVDVDRDAVIFRHDESGPKAGDAVVISTIRNAYHGMPIEVAAPRESKPPSLGEPAADPDAVARR